MAPTVTFIGENTTNNVNDSEVCVEKKDFPYEIKKLDKETNEELLNIFKGNL